MFALKKFLACLQRITSFLIEFYECCDIFVSLAVLTVFDDLKIHMNRSNLTKVPTWTYLKKYIHITLYLKWSDFQLFLANILAEHNGWGEICWQHNSMWKYRSWHPVAAVWALQFTSDRCKCVCSRLLPQKIDLIHVRWKGKNLVHECSILVTMPRSFRTTNL